MRTLAGERRGTLLAAIDRTVTAAGSRLLAQRLAAPLTDPPAIARAPRRGRLFRGRCGGARRSARAAQSCARSLPRAGAARGRPRRPARSRRHPRRHHRRGARSRPSCEQAAALPDELAQACARCAGLDPALAHELRRALADELPHLKRDGGFVRAGYDGALDEARALRDESRRVIAALQARYAEATGVRALKIRHNNVLGYFVEVTAQHGEKLLAAPLNATFIHRQTLAGQVRFTTTELGELEAKIASAAERALGIELDTFDELAAGVTAAAARDQGGRRGAGAFSTSPPRSPSLPSSASTCGPQVDALARLHHRGRPPSRGGADARRRRRAVRRQ